MNSHLKQGGNDKKYTPAREIVLLSLLGALLFALQVAMAPLPNIEPVSLLVIIYTLAFGRKAFYPIYIFVLLEGLLYGFHIWWISYLYIWSILAVITILCRRFNSSLAWAMISGGFGLFFGALCALPYLFTGGIYAAFSYWAAGLGFDLIHCAGNFVLALLLYKPLRGLFLRIAGHNQ